MVASRVTSHDHMISCTSCQPGRQQLAWKSTRAQTSAHPAQGRISGEVFAAWYVASTASHYPSSPASPACFCASIYVPREPHWSSRPKLTRMRSVPKVVSTATSLIRTEQAIDAEKARV